MRPRREPTLTVCDGRLTLGFVFARSDGRFDATDSDGVVIGTFDKAKAATDAILAASRALAASAAE